MSEIFGIVVSPTLRPSTFAIHRHVDQCQKLQYHITRSNHISIPQSEIRFSRCEKLSYIQAKL